MEPTSTLFLDPGAARLGNAMEPTTTLLPGADGLGGAMGPPPILLQDPGVGVLGGEHPLANSAVEWFMNPDNANEAVAQVTVPLADVKEEPKVEDVKEEPQPLFMAPTVVTVHEEEVEPPLEILGCGDIPTKYSTVEERKLLLDTKVRQHTRTNEGLRYDMLSKVAQAFIDGRISGMFSTHLNLAMHEETKAVNRRASRRRQRHKKKKYGTWKSRAAKRG